MTPLERIFETARAAPRHIILPEGDDPRVRQAARQASDQGLARVSLIGGPGAGPDVEVLDPAAPPEIIDAYARLRAAKGVTRQAAMQDMQDPIRQAAMRVRMGLADGSVAGAVATTADTVRAALQIIGRAPDISTVSSFFLMLPPDGGQGRIFSDCGLVIAPEPEQLADITLCAAASARALLREPARVAMLSFSTNGSAEHASVTRVRAALALARARDPDLMVDGELQFDAALDPQIRAAKAPGSVLDGPANVFIFPDLNAGNIGYKIAQRLGGQTAIGPVLQGLRLPANDLSRGCTADDIVAAIAVTVLQAGASGQ